MASDLISRGDALESLWDEKAYNDSYAYRRALINLVNVPAVDAEPVRHGEWKPYFEVMEVFTDIYLNTEEREVQTGWECSVCGRYSPYDPAEMPFCHCGAKMDGGVK